MSNFGRNLAAFLRKGSIWLSLGAVGAACSPSRLHDGSQNSSEEFSDDSAATQVAPAKARRPDFQVNFAASHRSNDFSPLKLVSSISYLEFSVKNCASGYSVSGLGAATQSFALYRYDQGCKGTLDRFTINGQIFVISPGQTFDPTANAQNSFTGDQGTVVQVKVAKQLPLILDTVNADLNFLITENVLGSNVNIAVYRVGVSVSPPTITEGDTNPATFLVKRASPGIGNLTVNLTVAGTATTGTDSSAVPVSVELLDGQASASFAVSALADAVLDDNETVIIGIGMGAYDPDPTLATLNIKDKPPMLPPTWNALLGSVSVLEDSAANINVSANNPNASDTLSYAINFSRTTCTTGWSTALSINSSGLIYGIADDGAVGTCLLVVTATNSVGTISQDINVTVLNTAELPAWQQNYGTASLFDGEALDLTFRAVDPDPGAVVAYSVDSTSTCLAASWTTAPSIVAATGRLTGTPSANSVGTCTILVKATSQFDVISKILYVTVSKRTLLWSAPSGVTVNVCVPLQVTLGDGSGRTISAPSAATLALAVNNGTGAYYSNASCGTAITTIVMAAGASSVSLYFKSTTAAQSLTMVVTGGTYDPGVATINIGSSASKLVVSGPLSVAVGQCVKFRIDQTDASGTKIAIATSKAITVTWPVALSVFSNATCDSSLYNPTIAPWDTGFDVYLYGVTAATAFLKAADPAAVLTSMQQTVTVTPTRSWWNSAWGYRSRIQLENLDQSTTFNNQPVLVRLTPQRIDYSLVKSDGSDLRFISSDNTTVLPYQIQTWVPNGVSLIWVKVDTIAASSSSSSMYLYYANAAATAPSTSALVWSDYTYVYHLTESPTATAPQYKDSTASANHGTAVANPKSSLSPVGACASFMGSLDYINMANNLSPILGATATFSAWVKTAQTGTTPGWNAPAITGAEYVGTTNDIQYGWLDSGGLIGVTAGDGAAAKSNFVVNDNAWRYISITRQATSGAVSFFVNGVQNGSGTSEKGAKTTPFSQIGILWNSGGTHKDFNGFVGEVRIFNGVMPAARIRADYKYQLDNYLTFKEVESY